MKNFKSAFFVTAIIAITAITFSGCKKKDTTEPPVVPPAVPLIKTISSYSPGGTPFTSTYTHEGGKVKTVAYSNGSSQSYRYTTDSVIISYYNTTNQLTGITAYKLGSNGMVQSGVSLTSTGAVNYNINREYNSGKYNTKETLSYLCCPSEENRYFFTGNVLDSAVFLTGNSIYSIDVTSEVETALKNTVGAANQGAPFFGASPMLRKKYTSYRYNAAGTLTNTTAITITYETDTQGRIVKATTVSNSTVSGTGSFITEYTYY